MKDVIFYLCLSITFFLFSCNTSKQKETEVEDTVRINIINYTVTGSFPHDRNSFTEGFLVRNGLIYESTGAPAELPETQSLLGIVDTVTGNINAKAMLNKSIYFGEGIAILNDKIYQLTYTTKKGFVYDATTFQKTGEFIFGNKEGWGLTTDGASLIMSDGTANLTYLSPENFSIQRTIKVSDEKGEISNLNELEYINGFIYANVYTTSRVIKIDPQTGIVTGEFDFSSLAYEARNIYSGSLEMNGIAYDPSSRTMLVTGKMWPKIYRLSFPQ